MLEPAWKNIDTLPNTEKERAARLYAVLVKFHRVDVLVDSMRVAIILLLCAVVIGVRIQSSSLSLVTALAALNISYYVRSLLMRRAGAHIIEIAEMIEEDHSILVYTLGRLKHWDPWVRDMATKLGW